MKQAILSAALVVAVVIWLLAGCRDYAAEARINADAQRDVARINADASVTRTQISETAATERNQAVVDVLPTGLLLIGIIGAAWLVLWYRGRAHLVRVQTLAQLTTQASYPPAARLAGAMPPRAVWVEAQRRGLAPVEESGVWLLVDTDGVPRLRMLAAPANSAGE
jgi:hypothetical protein